MLVVATAGERGLADAELTHGRQLGAVRTAEVFASAKALGCARVEFLGYRDSGLSGTGQAAAPSAPDVATADASGTDFATADIEEAAAALAAILLDERADLLTTYDPAGGYGHPDHVQVHRVGARAAELAGTATVLQATVDRDLLLRGLRLARLGRALPAELDLGRFAFAYTPRRAITHRVDVRRYSAAKRRSMSAHVSQASGGESTRTLAALLRLPAPVFRWVLGTEWYVQAGAPTTVVHRHPLPPPRPR